jgi:hypothetical protein
MYVRKVVSPEIEKLTYSILYIHEDISQRSSNGF